MKITRKQLRQIIKEELSHSLHESITDMTGMEQMIGDLAGEVADKFGGAMESLYDEEPDAFATEQPDGSMGRIDKSAWIRQVGSAEIQLEETIKNMVTQAVQDIEARLHGGDYYDSRDDTSSMVGRDSDNDEYPKTLGYKHPETGEKVMISVQSSDDMDDILDPLLRQYPALPYSVD